jgi:hypothetical protein
MKRLVEYKQERIYFIYKRSLLQNKLFPPFPIWLISKLSLELTFKTATKAYSVLFIPASVKAGDFLAPSHGGCLRMETSRQQSCLDPCWDEMPVSYFASNSSIQCRSMFRTVMLFVSIRIGCCWMHIHRRCNDSEVHYLAMVSSIGKKCQCHVHKSSLTDPILNQLNPAHIEAVTFADAF